MHWIEQVTTARLRSTPLLWLTSADPGMMRKQLVVALDEAAEAPVPQVQWDILNGLQPLNKTGQDALARLPLPSGGNLKALSTNPTTMLLLVAELPDDSMVLMLQAHRYISKESVAQAVWSLRDAYKRNGRTLVLSGPLSDLPLELQQDVVVIDVPLPDTDELSKIVADVFTSSDLQLSDEQRRIGVDSLRGLSPFMAEQVAAMSLTPKGLDRGALMERRRKAVEQYKGMSLDKPDASGLASLEGLGAIKSFLQRMFKGRRPPRLIVRLDEMEKMLAGAGAQGRPGDNTGVAQFALSRLLQELEDRGYPAMLLLGVPGAGKSALTKALSGEYGIPTIAMDLGAMRESLVGASESNVLNATRMVNAFAGDGGALIMGTCNRLDSIAAELRRRFRNGIWFFDLPTREELQGIWRVHLTRLGLEESPLDNGVEYTGADVRNICELASDLNCTLQEASQFVVPVSQSDPDTIKELRTLATNRFLSASYGGAYQGPGSGLSVPTWSDERPGRRIQVAGKGKR